MVLPALIAAAVVGSPSGVAAQEGTAPQLRRTLQSLEDSSRVQILAPGIVISDGLFLGVRDDSLRVAEADALLVVGLDEIEGFSVRGSRWRSLALQGAAVGIVAGFMAGYMKGSYQCGQSPDWCDSRSWREGVNWSATLGVSGAVLGGVIGSRLRRWRSIFP